MDSVSSVVNFVWLRLCCFVYLVYFVVQVFRLGPDALDDFLCRAWASPIGSLGDFRYNSKFLFGSFRGAEEGERAGVAVNVGGAADRANFPVSEKAAQWNIAQDFTAQPAIVTCFPVQVLATAEAGK